ncbi:MAG: rod-binding protein [Pirellulales bacterium]|nr:rod-binding protein [Pirellulales bacterium]
MDIRATMIGSQPASQPFGALSKPNADDSEVRKAFDSFVGETFYGQMLKSLRSMNGKTPYFDGSQAEEIFRNQLDQTLAQDLTKSTAHEFTGPMFDLFQLQRG